MALAKPSAYDRAWLDNLCGRSEPARSFRDYVTRLEGRMMDNDAKTRIEEAWKLTKEIPTDSVTGTSAQQSLERASLILAKLLDDSDEVA